MYPLDYVIRTRATPEQIADMLQAFGDFIKLAVDVETGMLAGGGGLHAECETGLLHDGSKQEIFWGTDRLPGEAEVRFGALTNIRSNQNNPAMQILDLELRDKIEQIVRRLLEPS